ncbi:hypothetical protein VEx25_1613 [Vibrio antiquarius]|uniref:Uncharacterized protein n=1 Tax=Vibrio antiquarius (strain Ex25) TaxID=150340 RepID=A0ABM9WQY7_VIBAE|nr:hypothetical protein VEx25_1613 [Vibrio antiquarius]
MAEPWITPRLYRKLAKARFKKQLLKTVKLALFVVAAVPKWSLTCQCMTKSF